MCRLDEHMLTDSKTLKNKPQSLGKLEKLLYRLCLMASRGALTSELPALRKAGNNQRSNRRD